MKHYGKLNTVTVLIWFLAEALSQLPVVASEIGSKPQNYDEIKALLDSYANAIDNYGDTPDSGRKKLLAGGDEETLALIALMNAEDPFGQYKSAIITILAYNKATNKKRSAALLADQLPDKAEQWDRWWIVEAIKFLTRVDADLARRTARKGLSAKMAEIKYAAVESLASVGTLMDVNRFDAFLAQWRAGYAAGVKYDASTDAMGIAIIAAEKRILVRAMPIELSTYLTFRSRWLNVCVKQIIPLP